MKELSKYIPKEATAQINTWLNTYNCQLKISKPRQTKLGDYRCPKKGKGHIISINNNLNSYAFLITLTHEIAHMMVWKQHQNKVLPHGSEWKEMFQKLMLNFLHLFPKDVLAPLAKHLKNPKASSSQDIALTTALRTYNPHQITTVADIPVGSTFSIPNGKIFIKLKKNRTRYQCRAKHNNRLYLFSPLAEVTLT